MQWVSRAGTEADLGDPQPVALLEQAVLERDLEAVEFELAHPAMLVGAHGGDAADDAPARVVAVEQEGREAAARIIGGAGDQDEVAGDGRRPR